MRVARARQLTLSRAVGLAVLALVGASACTSADDNESTDSSQTVEPSPTTDSPDGDLPDEPNESGLPSPADLIVAPGRIGPVIVGMDQTQAAATGLFETDVEVGISECRRVVPLAWKPPLDTQFDVLTTEEGAITSLGVRGTAPRTADGIGIGSSYADVTQAYPVLETAEAGYGQVGAFVHTDEGWLGLLFDIDIDNLNGTDEVTFVEVTSDSRPNVVRDGC